MQSPGRHNHGNRAFRKKIEMHGEKREAIIWLLENATEPIKFDKLTDIVLLRRGADITFVIPLEVLLLVSSDI